MQIVWIFSVFGTVFVDGVDMKINEQLKPPSKVWNQIMLFLFKLTIRIYFIEIVILGPTTFKNWNWQKGTHISSSSKIKVLLR